MLDHLAHVYRFQEFGTALDNSKLTHFRRCNARAFWPTHSAGQLITTLRPTRRETSTTRVADFGLRRADRLLLLDFVFEEGDFCGRAFTFFRGAQL